MFYSAELLTIKNHSGLGVVWLAATLGPKSNARKLNRRDFNNVDIVETCKFLEHPPEPLSLRLSSNLMVGVTRIYGQLWNCYQGDVSSLLANMSAFRHSKSLDMPIQRAPIEAITLNNAPKKEVSLENPLEMFERMNLDIFNDMNFNFGDVSKTPEQTRRLTAASASSTRPPSIDVGRGGLFDSRATSLSGVEPVIGTQFGANDEDMNYYGFGDDDYGFMMSGPESVSGLGSFGRAMTGSSGSVNSGLVLDDVPVEVAAVKQRNQRKAALGKGALLKLFDEETQLGKEELLLAPEEGLLDEESLGTIFTNYEKMFANPLIGSADVALFETNIKHIAEPAKPGRAKVQSTSGPSSEHFVPMDDDYGFMLPDHKYEMESASSGPVMSNASVKSGFMNGDESIPMTQSTSLRRLSEITKSMQGTTLDFESIAPSQSTNRRSASDMFYNVLVMACKGEVIVSQKKPYGPINIAC